VAVSLRADIDDFLSHRRLAIVGVSRDPRDFSRKLYEEFRRRGYDVYAVNPHATDLQDERCWRSIAEIEPPVDGAIVMTPALASESVVRDCIAAGVPRVWLYRAVGDGAVSPAAVKACQDNRISLIEGECPFMFLPAAGWIHTVHGFCRKLLGTYPS
jgi:uncharacterized protein